MKRSIPTLETSIKAKLADYGLKAPPAALRDLVVICTAAIVDGGNQTLDNVIGSFLAFTEMQPPGLGIDPTLKLLAKKPRGRSAKSTRLF